MFITNSNDDTTHVVAADTASGGTLLQKLLQTKPTGQTYLCACLRRKMKKII